MFSFISFSNNTLKGLTILFIPALVMACSPATEETTSTADSQIVAQSATKSKEQAEPQLTTQTIKPLLEVYKDPNCGCCQKWIDHIDQNGFQSNVINSQNVNALKQNKGIRPQYRSCHTAISKQGYVFEGHVPAKFIKQFLAEKHDKALGLSVPAMPIGTPGMEMGDRFMPYQVLLLKTDGSSEVYAVISSYKEQF